MRRYRIVEADLFQVVAPSIEDNSVWDLIAEFPSREAANAYIVEVQERNIALLAAGCG